MLLQPMGARAAGVAALATLMLVAGCAAPQASPSPEPPPAPSPAPTAQVGPSPGATPAPVPPASATVPPATANPTVSPTADPSAGLDGWVGPARISTRNYGELALVVDTAGVAHAAAELGNGIFYLTNGSGSWTRERLTRAPADGADLQPAIARDGDGTLWIAFTRWSSYDFCVDVCPAPDASSNDGVYVLSNAGGGWSAPERVATSSVSAQIAVGSGRVHLVYEDDWVTAGDDVSAIHHATKVTATWTTEHIANGYGPSLALDSNDMAHVAFSRSGRVYYAGPTGGGFEVMELSLADEAAWPRLSMDDSDRPHVAYTAWGSDDGSSVMHTTLSGGAWDEATLIAPVGLLRQLAVEPAGAVHVTYEISEGDEEEWQEHWYATNRGGAFETRRLIRGGLDFFGPGTSSALAIGHDGRAHVLFTALGLDFDDDPAGLWYAIGPGS